MLLIILPEWLLGDDFANGVGINITSWLCSRGWHTHTKRGGGSSHTTPGRRWIFISKITKHRLISPGMKLIPAAGASRSRWVSSGVESRAKRQEKAPGTRRQRGAAHSKTNGQKPTNHRVQSKNQSDFDFHFHPIASRTGVVGPGC